MLQGYLFLMEAERVLELTHQVHGDSIPKNDFFSYGLLEIASFFYRLFDIKTPVTTYKGHNLLHTQTI